jgi:uncharacterized protein
LLLPSWKRLRLAWGAGSAGFLISLALTACTTPPPATAPAATAITPLDHLPALKGDYFRIDSRETGRPYHIYVRFPVDYEKEPGRIYPIVYLTDGDSLFPILAAGHLFLHLDEKLPEALVVGIAYGSFDPAVNRRDLDFTPPGGEPGTGGAADFQRFLKTELLPEVERRYRADPNRRILFGQSRGGGFVLYSAFTDPDLFWGRVASNPALMPGRNLFFGTPAPAARLDLRLVVASGSRDRPRYRRLALEWFSHWQGRRDTPWRLNTITIEGGTHAADSGRVYRSAMLWLFGLEPSNRGGSELPGP